MDSTALRVCVCVCVCVCVRVCSQSRRMAADVERWGLSCCVQHCTGGVGVAHMPRTHYGNCSARTSLQSSQKHKKQGKSPCPYTPSKTPANHLCRGGFVNRDVQNACTLSCSLSPLLPGFPLALHRCGRNRPRKSPRYVH